MNQIKILLKLQKKKRRQEKEQCRVQLLLFVPLLETLKRGLKEEHDTVLEPKVFAECHCRDKVNKLLK